MAGLQEDEAGSRIEAAGLANTYVNFRAKGEVAPESCPFFRSVARGHVLSSQPFAGIEVVRGSVVMTAVREE